MNTVIPTKGMLARLIGRSIYEVDFKDVSLQQIKDVKQYYTDYLYAIEGTPISLVDVAKQAARGITYSNSKSYPEARFLELINQINRTL